jgi:hypothetical protein
MARPADRHLPRSPILAEISRLGKGWERLSPDLFKKLVATIGERPKPGVKATLLNKLDQIEKEGRQNTLVGQLLATFEKGTTHTVLSREKEVRAEHYSKTVKHLRCAADSLDRLAVIDSESETSARLASGAAAAEPWQTMGKHKSSLAVQLRQQAAMLEEESKAFLRGLSLRRLGVHGIYGNAESLYLLYSLFDLSYGELELLVEAAHLAWKKEDIDVDRELLKKTVTRFLKRNSDLAQSFGKQPDNPN